MKTFSLLELLFLRRMVGENMDKKLGRIQYYNRQIARDKQEYYEKLALVESEYNAMCSIKEKINDELALRELTK